MAKQIRALGLVLMALFTMLFVQLNRIQVLQADDLATAPGNTRAIRRDFSQPRGNIVSADGVLLAQSIPTDDTFERLRQYPEKDLFAHVTGYFSFTFGTEGTERTYNDLLTGRDLEVKRLRDVLVDRTRTNDVHLTVSKRLQQVARDALGARKGAVVALNPIDGSVLAMWSFPSFDPNPMAAHAQQAVQAFFKQANEDPQLPLLPRTYRRTYAPGSTFKVVTAAAALEQAPDLVAKQYPVLRTLDLPQTKTDLPNFGGSSCGGDLAALLKVSCNTGFAQLGLDLGAERLSSEAGKFGFRARPPLDLPAVAASRFKEAVEFKQDLPGLAQSAIGQRDVAATPLEMALVAAGVANSGTIMTPHVMADVRDNEGQVVKAFEAKPWMAAMSAQSASTLRDMMVGVVTAGTGRAAAIPGIQVAGKTGTAQTEGDNAHAWFIGFAPAEAPRVAVAVIVESQPGLGDVTGGRIAAPIARAVLQAALSAP
jgi:peptidoglycan glycosyltransferase